MSSSNPAGHDLEAEVGEESLVYRPVSTPAVVGLVFGLFSFLAYIHPLLWVLPLLGAISSGWALARLSSPNSAQIGRKAALIGLSLSLAFGVAGSGRWVLLRWQFKAETRHLAREWFEALHEGDPYRAHQLTLHSWSRADASDHLPARYAEPEWRSNIEEYLQQPLVQTMLSLGKYAAVRYVKNDELSESSGEASIVDIYAVSVEDQGKTVSFYVRLHWVRTFDRGGEIWAWRLSNAEFIRSLPPGLPQPA